VCVCVGVCVGVGVCWRVSCVCVRGHTVNEIQWSMQLQGKNFCNG
jgi:hypothetical protein